VCAARCEEHGETTLPGALEGYAARHIPRQRGPPHQRGLRAGFLTSMSTLRRARVVLGVPSCRGLGACVRRCQPFLASWPGLAHGRSGGPGQGLRLQVCPSQLSLPTYTCIPCLARVVLRVPSCRGLGACVRRCQPFLAAVPGLAHGRSGGPGLRPSIAGVSLSAQLYYIHMYTVS
jgi:NAD-dependent dihydropyrimidine dehydrogenase PreA subunit